MGQSKSISLFRMWKAVMMETQSPVTDAPRRVRRKMVRCRTARTSMVNAATAVPKDWYVMAVAVRVFLMCPLNARQTVPVHVWTIVRTANSAMRIAVGAWTHHRTARWTLRANASITVLTDNSVMQIVVPA